MELIQIAAIDDDNLFGIDNKLPWHNKEDLAHFRKVTMGYPIIMGRTTWEGLGGALEGRLNCILSADFQHELSIGSPSILRSNSFEWITDYLEDHEFDKAFVIGGAQLLESTKDLCQRLLLTRIPGRHIPLGIRTVKTFYYPDDQWELVSSVEGQTCTFEDYIRLEYQE